MQNYETMTPEQINALREYINTPSGKMLLQLIINRELTLRAEAWQKDTGTDRQIQLTNQEYGMYWVRTLIEDLITIPKKYSANDINAKKESR